MDRNPLLKFEYTRKIIHKTEISAYEKGQIFAKESLMNFQQRIKKLK